MSAEVRCEAGRWVVYLAVQFWEADGDDNPVRTVVHAIGSHATRQEAEVAAHWIVRGADRDGR